MKEEKHWTELAAKHVGTVIGKFTKRKRGIVETVAVNPRHPDVKVQFFHPGARAFIFCKKGSSFDPGADFEIHFNGNITPVKYLTVDEYRDFLSHVRKVHQLATIARRVHQALRKYAPKK